MACTRRASRGWLFRRYVGAVLQTQANMHVLMLHGSGVAREACCSAMRFGTLESKPPTSTFLRIWRWTLSLCLTEPCRSGAVEKAADDERLTCSGRRGHDLGLPFATYMADGCAGTRRAGNVDQRDEASMQTANS